MGAAGAATGLGAIGLGTTLAGTGFEIRGIKTAAAAARQRGDYQAAILRNNAILSKRAAADALARGQIAEGRKRTAIAQTIGSQRAALAASGVLVDEGSAADVIADTSFVGEQEILDLRTNAEREALAHDIEAVNFEADSTLARLVGVQQERAIKDQILPTILSGVGRAAGGSAAFLR